MTRRLFAPPHPCLEPDHGHVVLARRRPFDTEDDPSPRRRRLVRRDGDPTDFYFTAWLCPVRRTLNVMVEDHRPIEDHRQPVAGRLEQL